MLRHRRSAGGIRGPLGEGSLLPPTFVFPNPKLLGLAALASAFTLLYAFGDAMEFFGFQGNLDLLFVPLFGRAGYYLFEGLVPFLSLFLTFLSVWVAYKEGRDRGQSL